MPITYIEELVTQMRQALDQEAAILVEGKEQRRTKISEALADFSQTFSTLLSDKTREAYETKYLGLFPCPLGSDVPFNANYLRLRAGVAIDWAGGSKEKLALRLAYDLDHPEPLSSNFLFKMLESVFNSSWVDDVYTITALCIANRGLMALGAVVFAGAGITAAVVGLVTPVIPALVITTLAVSASCVLLAIGLELAFRLLYNAFNVKHKFFFTTVEDGERYCDINYNNSSFFNARTDRHLRPYDRLGINETVKDTVTEAPAERTMTAMA